MRHVHAKRLLLSILLRPYAKHKSGRQMGAIAAVMLKVKTISCIKVEYYNISLGTYRLFITLRKENLADDNFHQDYQHYTAYDCNLILTNCYHVHTFQ